MSFEHSLSQQRLAQRTQRNRLDSDWVENLMSILSSKSIMVNIDVHENFVEPGLKNMKKSANP